MESPAGVLKAANAVFVQTSGFTASSVKKFLQVLFTGAIYSLFDFVSFTENFNTSLLPSVGL